MLKTIDILRNELTAYHNPDAKIKRMANKGELIPIIRGLYETNSSIPGYYLAGSIYGPSYLSFEFALSYHSLIPEAAYHFTCATFEKKKKKQYHTPFGIFTYRDVPSCAYPLDIELKSENGYSYQIATSEKALCDILYRVSPLKNSHGLKEFLFYDLRIEPEQFNTLDSDRLITLSQKYKTQNHKLLESLIKKGLKHG